MKLYQLLPSALLIIALTACQTAAALPPNNSAAQVSSTTAEGLNVGMSAPDFSAKLINGSIVSLRSLRGKVVLLNFWATWCAPCKSEMPTLQTLEDRYKVLGFVVLAIDNREDASTIAPFLQTRALTFNVALDPNGTVNDRYTVRQYPTSYLIGRDGSILARQFGPFEPGALDSSLSQWLNVQFF